MSRSNFRAAAAVVLIRGHGESLEVFWVLRSQAVPFMPGFHAFVGGGVAAEDTELALDGDASDPPDAFGDPDEASTPAGEPSAGERLRILRACAIREVFEEAGVLIGRSHADGRAEPAVNVAAFAEARSALLGKQASFADLARRHRWRFRADRLAFAGRWMTPPFAEVRFDTVFFLARVPPEMEPSIRPGELASGEWIAPRAAIERWKRGEATFAAPILYTLDELTKGEEGLAERLAGAPARVGQPVRRIELKWGVVLHPMKTNPLPPATRTNAYLIGEGEMALIDPGSGEPEELEALDRLIARLAADGRRLGVILLSHHHPDHVGGASAVARRYGVPIAAHAETARLLGGAISIDRTIVHGETIALTGPGAWSLRAIHTPGHAPGHLCFVHERTRSLFAGDHIAGGRGTVIIDPPEGDMAAYVASLEALLREPVETLFAAHGAPSGAAKRSIEWTLEHRRIREGKVAAALGSEPHDLRALVERAYDDTPRELWGYAERSLLAHLLKLEAEGRAQRAGDRWSSG